MIFGSMSEKREARIVRPRPLLLLLFFVWISMPAKAGVRDICRGMLLSARSVSYQMRFTAGRTAVYLVQVYPDRSAFEDILNGLVSVSPDNVVVMNRWGRKVHPHCEENFWTGLRTVAIESVLHGQVEYAAWANTNRGNLFNPSDWSRFTMPSEVRNLALLESETLQELEWFLRSRERYIDSRQWWSDELGNEQRSIYRVLHPAQHEMRRRGIAPLSRRLDWD